MIGSKKITWKKILMDKPTTAILKRQNSRGWPQDSEFCIIIKATISVSDLVL